MGQVEKIREADREILRELLGETHAAIKRAAGVQIGTSVPATDLYLDWLARVCAETCFSLYEDDRLRGVCFAHLLGREAWIGPFGVFEGDQGNGYGRVLLEAAINALLQKSVTTIGLESPAHPALLGFFGRESFSPTSVALMLEIPVASLPQEMDFWVDAYSGREGEARERLDHDLARFVDQAAPGHNYLPLVHATREIQIGETLVFSEDDQIVGAGIVHKEPHFQGEGEDAVSVQNLVCHTKRHAGRLDQLITAIGAWARVCGKRFVRLRCSSDDPVTYQYLLSRGFRVKAVSLRLTLEGYPESHASGYVVLSSWQV